NSTKMLKIYKKNDLEIPKRTVKNKNYQSIAPNSAKKITRKQLQIRQKITKEQLQFGKKILENSAKNSSKFGKENYQIASNLNNSKPGEEIIKEQLQAHRRTLLQNNPNPANKLIGMKLN
ncbi:40457_t:CDS:2, partial [Gigaspora margarita]